ncbi:hypothetical protein PAECIP111891_04746 [Paenibacillus allorhizoplanae]|uniref:DUF4375 domain-containing protein n=1 Tax=Paenibacillus allorhizoplanae TaxID=2905648 RepID=A0ABN8GUF5_9BACL|nr:hypothetical protein [Paenibacillus allorhizoplanae]CAH1218534.1 hypothetical protein PAECIP111891_04746 [Paenibacillus allorhizoplanae]
MLVKMRQDIFHTSGDEALIAACFQPIIQAYKEIQTRGEDFTSGLFQELSPGQQALFAFHVYHTHAIKSQADFYWWSAYFLAQPARWSGLQSALRFFEDSSTLSLVEQMESLLRKRNHPRNITNFDISTTDLEQDPKLMSEVRPLYADLLDAAEITHQGIATYIRNYPDAFVTLR